MIGPNNQGQVTIATRPGVRQPLDQRSTAGANEYEQQRSADAAIAAEA